MSNCLPAWTQTFTTLASMNMQRLDCSIQSWQCLALDLAHCTTEQIVQEKIQWQPQRLLQQQANSAKLLQQDVDMDAELLELENWFLEHLHHMQ